MFNYKHFLQLLKQRQQSKFCYSKAITSCYLYIGLFHPNADVLNNDCQARSQDFVQEGAKNLLQLDHSNFPYLIKGKACLDAGYGAFCSCVGRTGFSVGDSKVSAQTNLPQNTKLLGFHPLYFEEAHFPLFQTD